MKISFSLYMQTAPPTIILRPDTPYFTIIAANDAYLNATESREEILVDRSLWDVFSENSSDVLNNNIISLRKSLNEAVISKNRKELQSQKYNIKVSDASRFNTRYWSTTVSPIINESGEVEYIALVMIDVSSEVAEALKERFIFEVSEEKRKAIQRVQEQLRLAIDSAEMGTWYLDLESHKFTASPRMKAIFGFGIDDHVPYEAVLTKILPEYRETVTRALDTAFSGKVLINIEFPITGSNEHEIHWVRATGKLYDTGAGDSDYFSGTVLDVTQTKLEEMRKNDFLSIASHELKTPLTTLKASLHLLNRMKNNPSAEMLPKLIDQSNKSMDKINSLVDDLLNVSRITEGKVEFNESVFRLSQLVNGCCDHVASAGKHHFVIEGDLDIQVRADEQQVNQVLVNLVNNAVKYAHKSDRIIVRVERVYPNAKISVQDFGPGIAKNHLNQLFKRYYRADTTSIQNNGLGLGLYICAEIIKKHGCQIGVTSELGEGSTFWFTLPLV